MSIPALSNIRTGRFSRNSLLTGAAVALVALSASIITLPADASTAKLKGLCTKSELGKKTTTLICSKSGSRFRWFKRTTAKSTTSSSSGNLGGASESVSGLPGASAGSGPVNIGVSVLPFGTSPAGATAKTDLVCVGLPATPNTATQTLTFPSAGGSNQLTFTVSPPSSANPTGSTCTVVATASVAAKLTILVDGTPVVGPLATTATSPAFTAVEGTRVTLLIDYSGLAAGPAAAAPAATLPPIATPTIAPATASTTVAPGAAGATSTTGVPTSTISPFPLILPASGKPEIATKLLTQAPSSFLGVTAELLCSPGAIGQGYQSQTLRFDRPSATLNPSVQLGPIAPGFGGTACQVDFALQGEGLAGATLRLLLNGQIQTNTLNGAVIKSSSFEATKPFNLTLEISFPGQAVIATSILGSTGSATGTVSTPTTTTTTTTIASVAAPQATVTLVRSATGGAAPSNLVTYPVTVSCTNAVVNGQTLAQAEWQATFPTNGGTAPVSLGLTPTSVCTTTVFSGAASGTSPITTGTFTITISGTVRGSTTNGTVTGGAIASPSAFAAVVTIGY